MTADDKLDKENIDTKKLACLLAPDRFTSEPGRHHDWGGLLTNHYRIGGQLKPKDFFTFNKNQLELSSIFDNLQQLAKKLKIDSSLLEGSDYRI